MLTKKTVIRKVNWRDKTIASFKPTQLSNIQPVVIIQF